jgi:WD40 repeat protein
MSKQNNKIKVSHLQTLTGHKGAIYKIIAGDQENQIISTGGDGWIAGWQPLLHEDGKLLASDEDNIFALTRSALTSELFLGTMQGNLLVVGLHGQPPRKISHHRKGIYDVFWDDGILYSAGGDGIITKWQYPDLNPVESIYLSSKPLRKMVFHPVDPVMAIGSSDGQISLLDKQKFKLISRQKAHDRSVFSLVFHPEGHVLYTGGMDAHLCVWSYPALELLEKVTAHMFTINDLLFNKNQNLLFSASRDKSIRIWDASTLHLQKVLDLNQYKAHINSVNTLHQPPDSNLLYSGSDDRTIKVWEVNVEKSL